MRAKGVTTPDQRARNAAAARRWRASLSPEKLEQQRERCRRYKKTHREAVRKNRRDDYHRRKGPILEAQARRRKEQGVSAEQREKSRQRSKRGYYRRKRENPAKARAYQRSYGRKRRAEDSQYRLLMNLRNRIRGLVHAKREHSHDLMGCTPQFLRAHLERQFVPGMTWENMGRGGWHVDHVLPCSRFDLSDEAQRRICFHFTNLQPLWEPDNIRKRDTVLPTQQSLPLFYP